MTERLIIGKNKEDVAIVDKKVPLIVLQITLTQTEYFGLSA